MLLIAHFGVIVVEDRNEIRLLTYRQAAKSLGVTERTVYSYVTSGGLIAIKLGRLRRIDPADLATFIAHKREVSHASH